MRTSGAPTVARGDLSDDEWAILEPLLPVAIRGRQALHLQRHVDGIRHGARVGCPWRDVPERYRAWQSLCRVFRGYQLKGVWSQVSEQLRVMAGRAELIEWDLNVESTAV